MSFRRALPFALSALALPSLVLSSVALAGPVAKIPGMIIPDRQVPVSGLIVKFKARSGSMTASAVSDRLNNLSGLAGIKLHTRRTMSQGATVLGLSRAVTADEARGIAERLQGSPEVEYASPDYQRRIAATPSDPLYTSQWHLLAPTSSYSGNTTIGGINMPFAWDIVTGSTSTVIAVLDTGILPHADIINQLLPGYDFISDTFNANDGNGRDADPLDAGDWLTAEEVAADACGGGAESGSSWHGTFVAGVAAATGNNSSGISGVNWNTRILPVRVLGKCGGSDSDIIDGMRWAAGLAVSGVPVNPNPADVINMSLGSLSECTVAWQAAVDEVHAAGVTIVAASGNEGAAQVGSPAVCANVIAVTAHTIEGRNTDYANVGNEIAISAPGGGYYGTSTGGFAGAGQQILSLSNTGTTTAVADAYSPSIGTSHATPMVTGVAALLRALAPTLTPDNILALIQAGARPHPSQSICQLPSLNGKCGTGMLDATRTLQAALAEITGNFMPVVSPQSVTGRPNIPVTFQVIATDADGDTLTFATINNSLPAGASLDSVTGIFYWASPTAGTHTLQVTASDSQISSNPQNITITITPPPAPPPARIAESSGGGSGDLGLLLLGAIGLMVRARRR